ncbi:hypothetical protein MKX01_006214 [Papaver californicum]|nr:hypothetical protein MKX01_006214 [Papaver californicum]
MGVDDLPQVGSLEYYEAMAHRDKVFRGRGLAEKGDDDVNKQLAPFAGGNETFRLASLGFLHYANVSLGTPSLSFLVALDTGSDLFSVPCDCSNNCVRSLMTRSGAEINLSIYSSDSSSTSKDVSCNSSLCEHQRGCSEPSSQCPYQVLYLSNNTASSGILVEDVLHLTTDNHKPKAFDARITFGATYNVSVTQLSVEKNLSDLDFSAIFISGTSFTYLNDPAYTAIRESFDSQAIHKRRSSDPRIPFVYRYDVSSDKFPVPNMTLIMEDGSKFNVYEPIIVISNGASYAYCLGVKSPTVNIIGQNFTTGQRIVFDREKMVLGWKASNCDEIVDPSTQPRNPRNSKESPPATAVQPRFTPGTPRNAFSSRAPQFSFGKPQNLYPSRFWCYYFPFFRVFDYSLCTHSRSRKSKIPTLFTCTFFILLIIFLLPKEVSGHSLFKF